MVGPGRKNRSKGNAPVAAHRREYERRVNRAIDYVQAHLDDELTLDRLAAVAAFSPFHFHRIFVAMTGETLSDFIRRIRLERAASMLALLHETSVLEIAQRYGFESAAGFARAFRSHFGMSATEWRNGGARRWRSKRGKTKRNPGQAVRNPGKASSRPARHDRGAVNRVDVMSIETREIPSCRVAYMRHVGPYNETGRIAALWDGFERWLRTRDLRQPGTLTIGIGHDSPRIAPADKLRYDACVVVDEDFKPDRFVNVAELPGGRYAVAQFEGTAADIGPAWEELFTDWLPSSGYQPEDRPCLELYQMTVTQRAVGDLRAELCVPVRPL
jgi:AraC family transcriptional regulator